MSRMAGCGKDSEVMGGMRGTWEIGAMTPGRGLLMPRKRAINGSLPRPVARRESGDGVLGRYEGAALVYTDLTEGFTA